MTRTINQKTLKDIRSRVEKYLRRRLPEDFWKLFWKLISQDKDKFIAYMIWDYEDVGSAKERREILEEEIIPQVKTYLEYYTQQQHTGRQPARLLPANPRETPPENIFTKMVAAYINSSPEVKNFRETFIGEKLLSFEGQREMLLWVNEQTKEFQDALDKLEKEFRWLRGTNSDWLPPWGITQCILTGKLPTVSLVTVAETFDSLWGKKYVLYVSPAAKEVDVLQKLKYVREIQQDSTPVHRKLSEKSACLAEFVLSHEGSWQRKMEAWNAKYPKWHYEDKRRFARDAKAALKRSSFGIFRV
ncbi:MAG: hypothetical protein WAQ23_09440 [bacterium]